MDFLLAHREAICAKLNTKHWRVGDLSAESNSAPQLPSAFHETAKMVEALLESASQAILSVDTSGKIVLANHRAEEMFNYTRDELLGASIEMLLPESKPELTSSTGNSTSGRRVCVPWASAWSYPAGSAVASNSPWK